MFFKIYFDNRPLILCDAVDNYIQPLLRHDDALFIDELNPHTVKTMIHEMQQPHVHAGIFLHANLDELMHALKKKFTVILAAGGLVKNEDDEILMIFRRGKWDLPKGKLDAGESLEECATREVSEETGLGRITLHNPLSVTYHAYREGTKYVLKESHWFAMTAEKNATLIPQTNEDIMDIRWIAPSEITQYLAKSFPLIADVLRVARDQKFISF